MLDSKLTPRRIVDALDRYVIGQDDAKKTVAVLIRSSWDLVLCPKAMTVVDAAGYRLVSIEAALSLIFGGRA